ncbi:MAG TPA: hypothetical protein VJ836_04860 [Candidatus Saccharimonadales bacterium]|nr:hypothetical protein [Candidatus Saccharimonadales bacterium]
MFRHTAQTTPAQKKRPNKLIVGFAALATTAIVATGGMAAAQTNKPSKAACEQAGYSNYGQCVRDYQHARTGNGPGNGYGGNNTANVNIDLVLNNSHNNVIDLVVNIFQ